MNNYSKARLKQWKEIPQDIRKKRTEKASKTVAILHTKRKELWETMRELIAKESKDKVIANAVRNMFS